MKGHVLAFFYLFPDCNICSVTWPSKSREHAELAYKIPSMQNFDSCFFFGMILFPQWNHGTSTSNVHCAKQNGIKHLVNNVTQSTLKYRKSKEAYFSYYASKYHFFSLYFIILLIFIYILLYMLFLITTLFLI